MGEGKQEKNKLSSERVLKNPSTQNTSGQFLSCSQSSIRFLVFEEKTLGCLLTFYEPDSGLYTSSLLLHTHTHTPEINFPEEKSVTIMARKMQGFPLAPVYSAPSLGRML